MLPFVGKLLPGRQGLPFGTKFIHVYLTKTNENKNHSGNWQIRLLVNQKSKKTGNIKKFEKRKSLSTLRNTNKTNFYKSKKRRKGGFV